MTTAWQQIKLDEQFRRDCAKADAKANRAVERAKERLWAAEEKEIRRHQKRMAEIDAKRRALSSEVYDPIYDPLEEKAFVEAEKRLTSRTEAA